MSFQATVSQGGSVITLSNNHTGCEAEIYAFGGLLNAFRIPSGKGPVNIIDGFLSVEDAKQNITNGFKSAKLSPFVCRMREGKYQIDGQVYTIEKFFLAGHAIHGLLFDAPFSIINTASTDDHASVTLEYLYGGTDPGYPFSYRILIDWKLIQGNRLNVSTTISNHGKISLPLADGWHPYFTLGGSVDDYILQFNSDQQLEYDAALLPTGSKFTDDRFIKGCSLKGIELDNSFELDSSKKDAACVLQNDALVLKITPDKSYPILQIYIPPHRKSIAIENLSGAPDNFNNRMGLLWLGIGEERMFGTTYEVRSLF